MHGFFQVYAARGKVLGGCSATNATLYTRGSAHDYEWDIPGWGSQEALVGFQEAENGEP